MTDSFLNEMESNMSTEEQNRSNISSAEMTALWRSEYEISKDKLSKNITTSEGKRLADQFISKYHYPIVSRKVSVRARFFLDKAILLLRSRKYDSCISFASGFSLLLYLLLLETYEDIPALKFIDTDLTDIIKERSDRLKNFSDIEVLSLLRKIELQALDLENACQEKRHLKDIFPSFLNPIFIIEGVIYFLSAKCVTWLFQEISSYENAAIILDYWPEEGTDQSKCFEHTVQELKGFMKENVVSFFNSGFWGKENFGKLINKFPFFNDISLMVYENNLAIENNEKPLLINKDEFFPVQLFIAETNLLSSLFVKQQTRLSGTPV
jgi:hypothetical protein